MILDRAINGPRASMETRTLSQEELGRFLKNLFLTGEDVEPGQRAAERLSPVAAAHRILSNSFGVDSQGRVYQDNRRYSASQEQVEELTALLKRICS